MENSYKRVCWLLADTGQEMMASPGYPSETTPHADTRLIIDSPDDIRPITTDVEAVRGSMVFFSASLSMFAFIALVLFFRKCVTCPSPSRSRHYGRPVDGAAGVGVLATNDAQPMTFSSMPSKLDELGLSPSVGSLIAQVDEETDAEAPDVRPPTRRSDVASETPEALCLQDDGTWDEEEDYV